MKTITKRKYDKGLRWLPFDNLHATTNQKHAGVTEGGWDRPRDRVRTLGECDGNDEPLAEGDKDDDDKYGEDRDIPYVDAACYSSYGHRLFSGTGSPHMGNFCVPKW
jgi:hypothetical protein